jgi:hypothetical protein
LGDLGANLPGPEETGAEGGEPSKEAAAGSGRGERAGKAVEGA